MGRQITADNNFGFHSVTVFFDNFQFYVAIVKQQHITGFYSFKNFFMRQHNTSFIARFFIHIQNKGAAVFEQNFIGFESTDAQFWTLHIGNNRQVALIFFSQLTHCLIAFGMFFVRAVAKVETESVNTGQHQLFKHFFRSCCRTDGG